VFPVGTARNVFDAFVVVEVMLCSLFVHTVDISEWCKIMLVRHLSINVCLM